MESLAPAGGRNPESRCQRTLLENGWGFVQWQNCTIDMIVHAAGADHRQEALWYFSRLNESQNLRGQPLAARLPGMITHGSIGAIGAITMSRKLHRVNSVTLRLRIDVPMADAIANRTRKVDRAAIRSGGPDAWSRMPMDLSRRRWHQRRTRRHAAMRHEKARPFDP